MLLIFLAAGSGKRLMPLTRSIPKCLVKLHGISLLERNLREWLSVSDFEPLIIAGHKSEEIKKLGFKTLLNKEYESTNMVWTLARSLENIKANKSDFIYISYGDVVISSRNITALVKKNEPFNLIIDLQWKKLWQMRMENVLDDAETLRFNEKGIYEIGKRPKNLNDIQGQYTGVIKIKKYLLIDLLEEYLNKINSLKKSKEINNLKNIFFTDFINFYIDKGNYPNPVFINGGWLEIDTLKDLEVISNEFNKNPIFSDLRDK